MKKVIEISGNHGFDRGVISYVQAISVVSEKFAVNPDQKLAMDFSNASHEFIENALRFIKKSFSKAHVRLIQID